MRRPDLDPERRAMLLANWQKLQRPGTMKPDKFCETLDALGWSTLWLANYLGAPQTTVLRWSQGKAAVPDNVAAWLDKLARFHRLNVLPEGWLER